MITSDSAALQIILLFESKGWNVQDLDVYKPSHQNLSLTPFLACVGYIAIGQDFTQALETVPQLLPCLALV